jgi:hypothetical protein
LVHAHMVRAFSIQPPLICTSFIYSIECKVCEFYCVRVAKFTSASDSCSFLILSLHTNDEAQHMRSAAVASEMAAKTPKQNGIDDDFIHQAPTTSTIFPPRSMRAPTHAPTGAPSYWRSISLSRFHPFSCVDDDEQSCQPVSIIERYSFHTN